MSTILPTSKALWRQSVLLAALALNLLAGCATAPTTSPAVAQPVPTVALEVSGSSQVISVLRALEPAFEASDSGYLLEIVDVVGASSGQAAAIEGVANQVLDVAAMSRTPKDEERARGLEYTEFGLAGVAIFAHPEVGVEGLSSKQVKDIFTGRITNWSEVGGPDLPIVLTHRPDDSTTTVSMREGVLGNASFATSSQLMDRTSELLVVVRGTPGSIGYALWPAVRQESADMQAFLLDGIAPTDPAYPMVQPLGIGYLSSNATTIAPLRDWLRSEAGRAELVKLGVIASAP